MVEIKEVTQENVTEFIDFPFQLYKKSPYWVGELKADTRKLFSPDNAFWKHGENKMFLAYKDGKLSGRIMALINRAHNEYHNEHIGFFGFFDCVEDDDSSHVLF